MNDSCGELSKWPELPELSSHTTNSDLSHHSRPHGILGPVPAFRRPSSASLMKTDAWVWVLETLCWALPITSTFSLARRPWN